MVSSNRLPLIIFGLTAIFFVIPFFFMVYGSIVPQINSTAFTLQYIVSAFTDKNLPTLLWNTLIFGGGGAVVSVVLGTIYAFFIYRTDVPFKRFLGLLPIFELTVPIVVKGISWIFLFSPSIGLVNIFFENVFHLSGPPFNIYSIGGLIFAWGMSGIAFVYILMGPVFASIESSMEEQSRVAGAGVLRTLRQVTLPLITPALLSTFLLWTIGGVENFDYPYVLGQQGLTPTLATQVFSLMNVFQTADASAWGNIYLLITVVLVSLYVWSVRKSFRYVTVTGKVVSHAAIHKLRRWKWGAFVMLLSFMVVSFFLPVIMVFLVSLVPSYTVGGGVNPFAVLNLNNYVEALFHTAGFSLSIVNSYEITIGAGAIATFIGSVMSYVLVKSKTRGRKLLEYITYFPVAFPSLVYSIALIWTFLVIPVFNTYLYGTIWVMLIAITTLWIPYSVRFMSATLIQLGDELEESAAVAGSGWLDRFRKITLPLLKRGVVNSFVYVMVGSYREIGAVILLYNSGSILLTLLILNLFTQSAATLPLVSALSIIMILILSASVIITRVLTKTSFYF